jgi:16S rRNA (guanine527-N7)-methyltransferase
MFDNDVKYTLTTSLNFNDNDISKLEIYVSSVLEYNQKYNLISRSTEKSIWSRHILDSAQILRFIDTTTSKKLADLGTGAGFPGIVLAIFNKNPSFHVKLYEKSKVKCSFLEYLVKKIKVDVEICKGNLEEKKIDADYVVCRAFKKFPEIIRISREIIKKPHKLIVLKGKNAQEEINNTLNLGRYSYRLENSITDKESKIIILDINKKK